MSSVLEDSLLVIIVGTVSTIAAGFIWLQTGYKALLYVMALAASVTTALVLLERVVETDREQITDTLQNIARDVQRNDLDAVLARIHPAATQARHVASRELPQYEFHHVDIKSNLEIEVFAGRTPKEAQAGFNVVVVLSDKSGLMVEQSRIPRYVEVTFEKSGDQWLATSYRHSEPMQGYRKTN